MKHVYNTKKKSYDLETIDETIISLEDSKSVLNGLGVFIKSKQSLNDRNSQEVCYKKAVLQNFAIIIGRLCWNLFLILQHRCFPVNSLKFLRTLIFKNTSKKLLPGWPRRLVSTKSMQSVEFISWNLILCLHYIGSYFWSVP